jgi:hypothetical protein
MQEALFEIEYEDRFEWQADDERIPRWEPCPAIQTEATANEEVA